jgi:cell division protein FtsW (lipid II flippase)
MSKAKQPESIEAIWHLRQPERRLFLWCFACVAVGFLMVLGANHGSDRRALLVDLLPLSLFGLSLLSVHLALVLSRFKGDQTLLAALAFLAGFGLLAQFRMGSFKLDDPTALTNYAFPAGAGVMVLIILAFKDGRYQLLALRPWVWGGISLLLVAAVLATGQRFRGGVYGAGFITPTEILKVTVVLFLAGIIQSHTKALGLWGGRIPLPPFRALLPLGIFWTLLASLLLLQRDLGMSVILSVALLAMLFVATGRIGYLIWGTAAAVGLGYLVLRFFLHGQRRIQAWQDPFQDPMGASWQILQGLSGMYSGGLWGEGFGQGNPEYTPIAQSDFIYSVIGEELGFVGCALVVVFFLIFLSRGFRIAYQTRSAYGMLLCTGLTTVIATQTFLNLGGVTKAIPLTGITLPFISHGGSSLLTGFVSLGLILAISEGETAATRRNPTAVRKTRRSRTPSNHLAGKRHPENSPRTIEIGTIPSIRKGG